MSAVRFPFTALALLLLGSVALPADAITREEALVRAKAYAYHPWSASVDNVTASCSGSYQSLYAPGDYMGLPYDWGGYMTLFQFDQQINAGYGAGSYPEHGVLSCTAGVDCSGFVSKAWDSGHYATATVHLGSSAISQNEMLAGDIFNEAGYHMAMYSHTLQSGEPVMYESVFYNVHYSLPGWSWVDGYVPRRYNNISGSSAGNPSGTSTNPIVISSFPFSTSGNTSLSASDVLDGCLLAATTDESGPEIIYQVNITAPGTLSVAVQDDAGVDIDVHLYTSTNSNDCLARHDSAFDFEVDCGSYFVVADTYKSYAGNFSLNVNFAPSGQSCGNGNPGYNFEGGLGSPCAYPGDPSLPFCNPNLDASACVYTDDSSFCSKACSDDNDCAALAGCCEDIGNQEFYCLAAELCGGSSSGSAGSDDPPDPVGDPAAGGSGGTGGAGSGAGQPGDLDDDGGDAEGSCTLSTAGQPGGRGGVGMFAAMLLLATALGRRKRTPSRRPR